MTKITYTDKVSLTAPSGDEINQWRDNNANEIKTAINENDTTETNATATVTFDKTCAGRTHGTFASPITANLVIDNAGVVEGGIAEVIWSGATNPTITGVVATSIQIISDVIAEAGVYCIFMMYSGGVYKVSISAKYQQYDSV